MSSMKSLTNEQINKLLTNTKSARDLFIIRLALDTGMRVGEIAALNVEDIQDNAQTIRVKKAKNLPEGRIIKLSSKQLTNMLLYQIKNKPPQKPLISSIRGTRMSKRQMQRIYKEIAILIDLPIHLQHIHALRYTYIRRTFDDAKENAPEKVIELPKNLGHKNFTSLSYYAD